MPLMALASPLGAASGSRFELCSVRRRGSEKMPTTSGDERAYSSPLAASPFSTATFLRTRVRKPSGPLVTRGRSGYNRRRHSATAGRTKPWAAWGTHRRPTPPPGPAQHPTGAREQTRARSAAARASAPRIMQVAAAAPDAARPERRERSGGVVARGQCETESCYKSLCLPMNGPF